MKVLQLVTQSHSPLAVVWGKPCMAKRQVITKCFMNKKGLAHTTATKHGNKLRTSTFIGTLQFCYFLFSSNNLAHTLIRFELLAQR